MYYYNEHHLYQAYCRFRNQIFNTREDYLNYCEQHNISVALTSYFKKSKYALEWEQLSLGGIVTEPLASKTEVFDVRDISNYYFETEEEANEFLKYFKTGSPRWALACPFSGYEGEPDYSADAIVNEYLKDIETFEFNSEKETKKYAHFIISYFPDDEVERERRKQAHLNQIKSIKAITPNTKVHIIAQNYKEEDFIQDPQIEYHVYDKLGAIKARNTALNLLYNSDYDFGIINDNDTFLAPIPSAIDFFEELENNTEKFNFCDIIFSRDMYHHPFKIDDAEKIETWNNNWSFKWTPAGLFHWAVFRNLKKFYNVEEYQDESIDPTTGTGYDDVDFCYYLQTKEYKIWTNLNALHSYAQNWFVKDSTMYQETYTNPWVIINNAKNNIKRWLKYDAQGQIDYNEFRIRTNHSQVFYDCARETPVDVTTEFTKRNASFIIGSWRAFNKLRAPQVADPTYNI